MAQDYEMKPGDAHYVVGAKEAYRCNIGDLGAESQKARRWLRAHGVTVYRLALPLPQTAVDVEDP